MRLGYIQGVPQKLYCSGTKSCKDITPVLGPLSLKCYGDSACAGMKFGASWKISCTKSDTCKDITWTKKGGGTFTCTGDGTCSNSRLICVDKPCKLICEGRHACENVVLSGKGWDNTVATTTCKGIKACRFAQLPRVADCIGEEACYGAKIGSLYGASPNPSPNPNP